MKTGLFAALLALSINEGASIHIRNVNHEFLDTSGLNPLQISQLMSGDWTAVLPESVRTLTNQLLNQGTQTTGLGGDATLSGLPSSLSGAGGIDLSSIDLNSLSSPFHKAETKQ